MASVIASLFILLCLLSPISAEAQKKGKGKGKAEAAEAAAEAPKALSPKASPKFVCESNVYYTWKPGVRRVKTTDDSGRIIEVLAPSEKKIEVFFVRAGDSGPVEKEVFQRLVTRVAELEAEALDYCYSIHQNISGCVGRRLKQMAGGEYHFLDFAVRRALLESAKRDCEENNGVCLSTRTSTPACFEDSLPDLSGAAPAAEAAAGEEDSKDKKDKKKK